MKLYCIVCSYTKHLSNMSLLIGGAGNDDFYIVSTDPQVASSVYGTCLVVLHCVCLSTAYGGNSSTAYYPIRACLLVGDLGSDTFIIAPPSIPPVISKNLRGHRGILEHSVSSSIETSDYTGLLVEGVAVNILDNDGLGYISVIEDEAVHVITENSDDQFTFYLFPTLLPEGLVRIEVTPQDDGASQPYMLVALGDAAFELKATHFVDFSEQSAEPVGVKVKHNPAAKPLDVTDFNVMIRINLSGNIDNADRRFVNTKQSILPVDVLLLPALDSLKAKSVTVVQPTGKTAVIEGGDKATYDVYLRPCNSSMISSVQVNVSQSVLNQLELTGDIVGSTIKFNETKGCKSTVEVSAQDDLLEEGIHFVSLGHSVKSLNGGSSIKLSDNSTLFATNVLVAIHDTDMTGVVIDQPFTLRTAEIDGTTNSPSHISDPRFYEDEYRVRLTKAPASNETVIILIESVAVASDSKAQLLADGISEDRDRRIEERQQVLIAVNGSTPGFAANLTFTASNWEIWQNVSVSAYNDNVTEGVDLLNFPSQPSFLSYIQGPLTLYGLGDLIVPEIEPPLMLPSENDTETVVFPEGVTVDLSSFDAIETKQVDRLVVNNGNARGTAKAVGVLTADQFSGMNMGRGIQIGGVPQADGFQYFEMELVEVFLGDGVDEITVLETSEALHYFSLGGGDDSLLIEAISGPFLAFGGSGNDAVTVAPKNHSLDTIKALLAFDGGAGVDDSLILIDNSTAVDDVLNLTRLLVEVESIEMPASISRAPRDSYLISLRGATGGSFDLHIDDPEGNITAKVTISLPIDVSAIEEAIDDAIFVNGPRSCGLTAAQKEQASTTTAEQGIATTGTATTRAPGTTTAGEELITATGTGTTQAPATTTGGEQGIGMTECSLAVKVYKVGDHLALFFVGERLNSGVELSLDTSLLTNYTSELFLNRTNDLIQKNSDVMYANLGRLDIDMGANISTVLNVRGTTATTTRIFTKEEDDFVFISSDANENPSTAETTDFLEGWCDYIEADLGIVANGGRNRLMISDESSSIAKGAASTNRMKLQNTSLTDIHATLGDISFTAENGDWSRGVNVWLSTGPDMMEVLTIPSNTVDGVRTTTSIHAGAGDDDIVVSLADELNPGTLFVANGQEGDDTIDGSLSSLPLILFGELQMCRFSRVIILARHDSHVFPTSLSGEGGNDTLTGGSGNDVVFGDFGTVKWVNKMDNMFAPNGIKMDVVAVAGGGGPGDYTDGVVRNISEMESVQTDQGGNDTLVLGQGDDVAFGGFLNDKIRKYMHSSYQL